MQMQKCKNAKMHFTTRLIFRVKKKKDASRSERLPCLQAVACCCNPLGARTQDPHIKSVMLYQLS